MPEDKVVFGSFNKPAKITADVAALWARVLEAVPDSVLWVLCQPGPARENFVRHMQGLGIDPSRVIYMPRADYADHLARMASVDIALDTFPYSGHTTTSDCLWTGVPVVALKGTNFASRVSKSLLTALGLGELVARDEQAFVDIAVAMARSPLRRRALKARIEPEPPAASLVRHRALHSPSGGGLRDDGGASRKRLAAQGLRCPRAAAAPEPFRLIPLEND